MGDLWCLHFYRYRSKIKIGPDTFEIFPGCIGITPPCVQSEYIFSERSTHGYVHYTVSFETAIGVFPSQPLHTEIKIWDLLLLHAQQTAVSPDFGEPVHPAVNKALQIIEARMGEPLAVGFLAESVGLSHNHLTRLFQKHLGKTVVGHLIERRLIRAEHLLKHSDMPIKQVAAQVGIPDLQAFNKAIRNRYQRSPRELRGSL
jgi:AraC family transcriptional regulator